MAASFIVLFFSWNESISTWIIFFINYRYCGCRQYGRLVEWKGYALLNYLDHLDHELNCHDIIL